MSKYLYYSLFIFCCFSSINLSANCPGCVIDVPMGLPEDTLYLGMIPNGTTSMPYDEDVSFRMPMTTTPVSENDPDIPSGLGIEEIKIISVTNLPPGLSWETDDTVYDPQTETDGCFKFCGTPLVPGTYVLDVTVEAKVVIFSQQVSFPMTIIIEPASSINDGFSITNNIGCGEVTASFENNVASNGDDGFTYNWDFGNGNTSIDENPADQVYDEPGTYIVNYEAIIDTIGYILTRVNVTDVSCFDIPTAPDFSNNPDMHVEIFNPNGTLIFESETIPNTDPPVEYFPNVEIGEGVYELRVIDSDSGINGADDVCIDINFNLLSDGTISTSDFALQLDILHPVDTVMSADTIIVHPIPDAPVVVSNSGASEFCAEEMVILTSSYGDNNQWFLDGEAIAGATAFDLEVFESGAYQVAYTSVDGCTARSEALDITINEAPETPEYSNTNNLLTLLGSIVYSDNITFQWYQNGNVLEGETSSEYCALEDGGYTLEVTNVETGCVNTYQQSIDHDESLECFTSSEDLANTLDLNIYPNPVSDQINVSFNVEEATTVEIRFYDMFGRLHNGVVERRAAFGSTLLQAIAVDHLPAGMHFIELRFGEEAIVQKFVKKN